MKKFSIIIVLIMVGFSCTKDKTADPLEKAEIPVFTYNAQVGQFIGCSSPYWSIFILDDLDKFPHELDSAISTSDFKMATAIGLPDSLKVEGLLITVELEVHPGILIDAFCPFYVYDFVPLTVLEAAPKVE